MIALLVFLALVIPIGIHLISRSEGKVVLFPFLALLPAQSAASELHIKLRQRWLLLVRLLLLLCAGALVTISLISDWFVELGLNEVVNAQPPAPTVIVTQDWWNTSNEQEKNALKAQLNSDDFEEVESIVFVANNNKNNKGENKRLVRVSSRNFEETFKDESSSDDAIDDTNNSARSTELSNIWSTAQVVAQSIPVDSPLHIYTSNRYSQFVGGASYVRERVVWHISSIDEASQDSNKPTFQLALIGLDLTKASEEQIQRMAQTEIAIRALQNVYPSIVVNKLRSESVSSLTSLSQQYDAIVVDAIDDSEMETVVKVVQVSKLSSSQKAGFVLNLGAAIFKDKQQEYLFFNTWLSAQQIQNSASSAEHLAVSALPESTDSQLKTYLAILLVILFLVERLMSEMRDKQGYTKQNAELGS